MFVNGEASHRIISGLGRIIFGPVLPLVGRINAGCQHRQILPVLGAGGAATRWGQSVKNPEQMRGDRQRLTDALTIRTD